jgi:hypothetical protein
MIDYRKKNLCKTISLTRANSLNKKKIAIRRNTKFEETAVRDENSKLSKRVWQQYKIYNYIYLINFPTRCNYGGNSMEI